MAPTAVRFRFYAGLNDFLPPDRRAVRFPATVGHRASVKDAIESTGVPHPEVELILVNGEPASFSRLLVDGDDLSVFPRLRSLATGALPLRGPVPQPLRFITDVHLGRLTSLLRVAGFDATTAREDDRLAANSARDGRVLLTRDVGLLKRAIVVHGYWVRHTAPWLQLQEVVERFDAAGCLRPFTRCARCNGVLEPASKESVADRLPPRTGQAYAEFRACGDCGAVYWRGSHHERIVRRLAALGC